MLHLGIPALLITHPSILYVALPRHDVQDVAIQILTSVTFPVIPFPLSIDNFFSLSWFLHTSVYLSLFFNLLLIFQVLRRLLTTSSVHCLSSCSWFDLVLFFFFGSRKLVRERWLVGVIDRRAFGNVMLSFCFPRLSVIFSAFIYIFLDSLINRQLIYTMQFFNCRHSLIFPVFFFQFHSSLLLRQPRQRREEWFVGERNY